MSTTRRVLGTGPATTTRSTTSSPRLLPIERVQLVDGDEHQDVDIEEQPVQMLRGRRALGPGPRAEQDSRN
ncbi:MULTISPECIES: hypothetical protein [unclassified Streptomyces]|uniref:hypothetical protein n=1 Tax=unclassified Streptomyces TaxID=2593676 RepID=UPI0035E372E9